LLHLTWTVLWEQDLTVLGKCGIPVCPFCPLLCNCSSSYYEGIFQRYSK